MSTEAQKIREQIAKLQSELAEAEKAEQLGAEQAKAKTTIAYVAAFKASRAWLMANAPEHVGEQITNMPVQALPREGTIGNKVKLSETEVSLARERGRKAVAGL